MTALDEFDPSKPLADRKREKFCQELSAGVPLDRAYEAAGFRRPRGNANRMEREPQIVARLEYLRAEIERYEPILLSFRRAGMRRWLENIRDLDRRGFFFTDEAGRLHLKPLNKLT